MPGSGTDDLGGRKRPSADENREPTEQRAFRLIELLVAPIDRSPERAMVRQLLPRTAGEETNRSFNRRRISSGPRARIARRPAPKPKGAHPTDGISLRSHRRSRRDREVSADLLCAIGEQSDGFVGKRCIEVIGRLRVGVSRGGTTNLASPGTPNASRLVASVLVPAEQRRIAMTSSAQASTRCSQLSSTSSAVRLSKY